MLLKNIREDMDRNNIHMTVRGVIICDGHILMCKPSNYKDGYYFLPGGHIEHREDARSALLRELEEEIGFKCEIESFLGVLEYILPEDYPMCHNHGYTMVFKVALPEGVDMNTKFSMVSENESLVWVKFISLDDHTTAGESELAPYLDPRVIQLFSILSGWLREEHIGAIKRFF